MSIPSSGPISFSKIKTEFNGINPIYFSDYYDSIDKYAYSNDADIPDNGTLKVSNFKGKSSIVKITGTNNLINNYIINSIKYKFAIFKNNGTFTFNKNLKCDILIVGGGGGGGGADGTNGGGGGGGGAVLYITNYKLFTTYSPLTISIGSGGIGSFGGFSNGTNGNQSSILIDGITFKALGGGGGGGGIGIAGNNSGSGGGGGFSVINNASNSGGVSTKLRYYNWTSLGNSGGKGFEVSGYCSGGGGGAGSAGTDAQNNKSGNGGSGINLSSIFGTNVGDQGYFAGGGGGGTSLNMTDNNNNYQIGFRNGGNGLFGGGGNGGYNGGYREDGLPNTGGGGGGGGGAGFLSMGMGGDGGSGIVIIKYYIDETITGPPSGNAPEILETNYAGTYANNPWPYGLYTSMEWLTGASGTNLTKNYVSTFNNMNTYGANRPGFINNSNLVLQATINDVIQLKSSHSSKYYYYAVKVTAFINLGSGYINLGTINLGSRASIGTWNYTIPSTTPPGNYGILIYLAQAQNMNVDHNYNSTNFYSLQIF